MSNRNQGFTLVELVITLAILGVVVSIAVPAVETLITQNRQNALLKELWAAVQGARAAAIMRKEPIEICASKDGTSCVSDWKGGWLVRSPSAQKTLNVNLLASGNDIRWRGMGQSVRFRSNGTTLNNGSFYQCHDSKVAWQLKLNRQGRLRKVPANEYDSALCS
ncbi:prepilin-type N-terminal cleavage/methylation domain-containing protein [Stutzerimonas stutzeri]|jgi:type IV fimbrial biogenesis protein FimT|nr:GspH/FimT family pseudopilin [Stutzerimonas stutzeri]HAG21222.1 prepilin-type N-terminal cleavage/methylation domain-containing protein [Pseudomonas sp.]MBO0643217.1 GspH/FimT family pseudopilin [Stutzerimonas stutzeri]MDH0118923.1 GspH/FimT family pseudopilin [Stutzerimonas stutzeri]MTI91469.1 prepilin-type N-terminal cleavage/methylation domain-containing protein [Stutzerimonas stutzeri]RRV85550.1 prepilin-type N-terminal cleavage/methylation domain-containing protein [Stutzerimonas stutz